MGYAASTVVYNRICGLKDKQKTNKQNDGTCASIYSVMWKNIK